MKQTRRERYLLKTYGITPAEYDNLRNNQQNVCKLCYQPFTDKEPVIDQDNITRVIIGLLHKECYLALSAVSRNPDKALLVYKYLVDNHRK